MVKLVKESLNEVISFERYKDPLSALDIGYKKKIEDWLKKYNVKNYVINDNLSIDVNDNVDLFYGGLIEFPNYIQFNIIKGYFGCDFNHLISLKGGPNIVHGTFGCIRNQLTSLKGCPSYVGSNFVCGGNKVQFTEEYIRKMCVVKGKIIIV